MVTHRLSVLGGALLLLATPILPNVGLAQDRGLAGKWTLNEEESDDPRAAFEKSMRGAREGMSEDGSRPPGGRPSGGRGGRPGGGGRGGQPGGGRDQGRQGMQRLMEASAALNIVQDDSTVTIVGAEGSRLILYPDGRRIEYPIEDAGNVETRAYWDDGRLVVERKAKGGPTATSTYELTSGGRQLHIRTRLVGGAMTEPVEFRRVYDLKDERS